MYSLSIIGGGMIACGYDTPDSEDILTHIHGALSHPNIKLDAIVEIDKNQQEIIRNKWGDEFNIFSNIEDLLEEYQSDIVVIATPTKTHLSILENIYKFYEPKLILCEKPIVLTIDEYSILENLQKYKSTKLLTNYIRRFDPSLNYISDFIKNRVNTINHFYGTFTKGFLHNGSHMIDLIYMLIGDISNIKIVDKQIINRDVFGQFLIDTNRGRGVISNINDDFLSLFEFTIYTDIAKIEIRGANQDITITHINKSSLFKGYKSYLVEDKVKNTLNKYGYNTLNFITEIIENDNLYNEIIDKQSSVNKFLLNTQNKWIG